MLARTLMRPAAHALRREAALLGGNVDGLALQLGQVDRLVDERERQIAALAEEQPHLLELLDVASHEGDRLSRRWSNRDVNIWNKENKESRN